MVVGKDGVFLTKIWDPNKPTQVITNYYNKPDKDWGGQTWSFRIQLEDNSTAIYIANYSEISFSDIKEK
jgi:hypothetical protein